MEKKGKNYNYKGNIQIHGMKEKEPYYPINNEKNNELYEKYKKSFLKKIKRLFLEEGLGHIRYYDMDKVIKEAINCVEKK